MQDRFMRRPEVLKLVGVSESTLYAMIRARNFPPPIRIADRATGFSRRAVDRWMQDKIEAAGRHQATD